MKGDAELFSSRPARAKTCTRCRGSGEVGVPYWLKYVEDPGRDDDPLAAQRAAGAVTARPVMSASIFECCREAREVAEAAGRPVAFCFMEQVVVVGPTSDPDAVARAWWLAAYGETPEQTAERR